MLIELSDLAKAKVRHFLQTENGETQKGLRIYVEGGGCSGFQYGFSFDVPADDDSVTEIDGIRVLIDPISAPYITSSLIDYQDGLSNAGFVVKNPNAKTTCGCGVSFNI